MRNILMILVLLTFNAAEASDAVTAEGALHGKAAVQAMVTAGRVQHIVVDGKPRPLSASIMAEFKLTNGEAVPAGRYTIIRAYILNNSL